MIYYKAGQAGSHLLTESSSVKIKSSWVSGTITLTAPNGKVKTIPLTNVPYFTRLTDFEEGTTLDIRVTSGFGTCSLDINYASISDIEFKLNNLLAALGVGLPVIGGKVTYSETPPVTTEVVGVTTASGAEGSLLVHTVTLNRPAETGDIFTFEVQHTTTSTGDYTLPPTFSAGVTLSNGFITIPSGVSTFTVSIQTTDDAAQESTETYSLNIDGIMATGTIFDNDTPIVVSSVSSPSANEGSALVFVITLSGITTQQEAYAYSLGGTATGGDDYALPLMLSDEVTIVGGNMIVPVGVSSFSAFSITTDDIGEEASETVVLTVGGVVGTGTILDSDSAPVNGYMAIGANTDFINDYETSGSLQRVNLADGMRTWVKQTGTGDISNQSWGAVQLSTTDTVAQSVFIVRSGEYPDATLSGFYEIWGQLESGSGGNLTVNGVDFTNINLTSTLDATFKKVAEFTYNPVTTSQDHNQFVWFYGTTSKLIKLYIGKASHVSQYNAGNVWHPNYLARVATRAHWRSMNHFMTSVTVEQSAAHRQLSSHIRKPRVPIEEFLDLCDRAIVKPYLNLPQMMDSGYATLVGGMLDTWLTGRNTEVIIAQGNEMTFNGTPPWRQGLYWAACESLTKVDSIIDTDGSIISPNHGLVNGDTVFTFVHQDDLETTNLGQSFPFGNGNDPLIQVKNSDAFFILDGGNPSPKPSAQSRVIWVKKPASFDFIQAIYAGKAAQHVRMAEAINAELSATNLAKVKYVIEGHAINAGAISGVLSHIPTGKKSAVYHYASVAPYSNGVSFGARVIANNGSIELGLIGINSRDYKQRVYYGLYPSASSPTNAELIAGTGSLEFGNYLIPDASFTVAPYNVADTMTGANGTAYKLVCVTTLFPNPEYLVSKGLFSDIALQSRIEVTFTLTASPVTHYADMSHADKLEFDKLAMKYAAVDLEQNAAVAEGRPLFNYEDAAHYDQMQDYNVGASSKLHYHDWLKNYINFTAQGTEWFERLYHTYAVYSVGATLYKSGTLGRFMVDGNYITGKTQRSTMLDGYSKQIPRYSKLPKLNTNVAAVSNAPVVYPSTILALLDDGGNNTLDSGAVTYSIVGNNSEFQISGNNLQVTSAVSGLFTPPTLRKIIIKSETPKLTNFNELTVQFGEFAYYQFFTGADANIPAVNVAGDPAGMRLQSAYDEINTATEKGVSVSVIGRYNSYSFDVSSYLSSIASNELVMMKGKFACGLGLSQFADYEVNLRVYRRSDNVMLLDVGTSGWQIIYGTSIANATESTFTFQNGATEFNTADHLMIIRFVPVGTITATEHTLSVYNVYRVY